MTYLNFIINELNKFEVGKPIYLNKVSKDLKNEFNLELKEALEIVKKIFEDSSLNLRLYKKGIYYKTSITPFGEVRINEFELIKNKYLDNDNGYLSDYIFLWQLGLTTQIPNKVFIVSNKAQEELSLIKEGYYLKRPKVRINKNNKYYLQSLDAVELIDKAPIDVYTPYFVLAQYIIRRGLDYDKLIALAKKYYSNNVVGKILEIKKVGVRNG